MTSEQKMKICIDNYFAKECNINMTIKQAFQKGFRLGIKKAASRQWVPVSKRLPKAPSEAGHYPYHGHDTAADEYIVMIRGAKIPTSLYWTGRKWFSPYGLDSGSEYDVVAWMPMPDSYKEGDAK